MLDDLHQPAPSRPPTDPAVTFESITFSDGTTISLDPADVLVLVGPNNAGKSVALRELETHAKQSTGRSLVVTSAKLRRTGTLSDLLEYLKQYTRETHDGATPIYTGYRVSIPARQISSFWSGALRALSHFFCMRLQTETRITDSNPPSAIRTLEDAVSHPIHMLYVDDELELRRVRLFFVDGFFAYS